MSEVSKILGANSEAAFRALMECSPDFIALATTHGELFYMNATARHWTGLEEAASPAAASLKDFYSEESCARAARRGRAGREQDRHLGRRSRLQNVKTRQQSNVLTYMYRLKTAQGKRASCLAIVHREAESMSRLRDSLTEAQARKTSMFESSLDPIITINHEGLIIEFNRAAEQTFGYPRDKVLGTRPADVLFPPSLSAGHASRIERYLEAGEGSMLGKRVEVTASRANGEEFHAEMAMTISQINGAGDHLLRPRHQRAEEGRGRAGPLRRRAGALQPRPGAIRLRGLARLAGAAAEDPRLRRPPGGEVQGPPGRNGAGVRQPHAERRRADAGADRGPAHALPRDHPRPRLRASRPRRRSSSR